MIKPEDIVIIIPHLGVEKQQTYALKECLISLNETAPQIKKIVAFNGNYIEKALYQRDSLNLDNFGSIFLPEQGQCKATNAAVATTNTEWIMVSNDDMIYPPGWYERLADHENSCISPKLVEPIRGAPTFETQLFGGAGGNFDKARFLDFARTYQGQGLRTGFNLPFLIKRDLWDLVGGYDINYDPWGSNSDSDLEYKIKLAGVQPMQDSDCIVYHFSQTSQTFHPDNFIYYQNNLDYFERKWGFPRTDDGIWQANFKIPYESLKFKPKWAVIPGENLTTSPKSNDL